MKARPERRPVPSPPPGARSTRRGTGSADSRARTSRSKLPSHRVSVPSGSRTARPGLTMPSTTSPVFTMSPVKRTTVASGARPAGAGAPSPGPTVRRTSGGGDVRRAPSSSWRSGWDGTTSCTAAPCTSSRSANGKISRQVMYCTGDWTKDARTRRRTASSSASTARCEPLRHPGHPHALTRGVGERGGSIRAVPPGYVAGVGGTAHPQARPVRQRSAQRSVSECPRVRRPPVSQCFPSRAPAVIHLGNCGVPQEEPLAGHPDGMADDIGRERRLVPQGDPLPRRRAARRGVLEQQCSARRRRFLLRDPGRGSSCGTPVVVPGFRLRGSVTVPPRGPVVAPRCLVDPIRLHQLRMTTSAGRPARITRVKFDLTGHRAGRPQ